MRSTGIAGATRTTCSEAFASCWPAASRARSHWNTKPVPSTAWKVRNNPIKKCSPRLRLQFQLARIFAMRRFLLAALLAVLPGVAHAQNTPAMPHEQATPGDAREYPSLKIAGFGDLNFSTTKRPEGARGFTLGQFVLHMTSALSPRVTFFGELSFTARSDAGTGSPSAVGFNTEVERMIIRFDHSDYLKMSLGRYHTPINFWNTEFHHGQWLQTTIQRPEIIQFGGR